MLSIEIKKSKRQKGKDAQMQKRSLIFVFMAIICLTISCTKKHEVTAEKNQGNESLSQNSQESQKTELIDQNPESANLIFQYELAKKSHNYLLSKYKSIFSEKDGNLTITDKKGNSKKFVVKRGDVNESWSQNEKDAYYSSPEFVLVEYYEHQQYALLLDIRYMGESWSVLLVDLSNNLEELYLEGWPRFSKTQSKFITFNKDLYAGFSNNGIGIYSYGDDCKVKKEYVLESDPWGPQSVEWVSNTEISIQANHICEDKECSETKKLLLINGEWILKENPSSSSDDSNSSTNSSIGVNSDSSSGVSSSSIEHPESLSETKLN